MQKHLLRVQPLKRYQHERKNFTFCPRNIRIYTSNRLIPKIAGFVLVYGTSAMQTGSNLTPLGSYDKSISYRGEHDSAIFESRRLRRVGFSFECSPIFELIYVERHSHSELLLIRAASREPSRSSSRIRTG